jgi:DNA polymerase elongation subunit (family B)
MRKNYKMQKKVVMDDVYFTVAGRYVMNVWRIAESDLKLTSYTL